MFPRRRPGPAADRRRREAILATARLQAQEEYESRRQQQKPVKAFYRELLWRAPAGTKFLIKRMYRDGYLYDLYYQDAYRGPRQRADAMWYLLNRRLPWMLWAEDRNTELGVNPWGDDRDVTSFDHDIYDQ